MTLAITSPAFKQNAGAAIADPQLQGVLRQGLGFIDRRQAAIDRLPEFDALRDSARDIKDHTLAHLDLYLEAYEERVRGAGGHVHYAVTPDEARNVILDICRPRPSLSRCHDCPVQEPCSIGRRRLRTIPVIPSAATSFGPPALGMTLAKP